MIPAAGLGTRMLPATKVLPKELLPVAAKPLIQYAVEEAAASGIDTVIIVVRQNKSLIEAYFAPDRALELFLRQRGLNDSADVARRLSKIVRLKFVTQRKPQGLGNAVSCARPLLGDHSFVVLLPDVIMVSRKPVTSQLICAHKEVGGNIVAVREVPAQDVERFGIVQTLETDATQFNRSVRVTRLVEKPSPGRAPSRLGVFGRYVLEPAFWAAFERTRPDANGEVQLTDAIGLLCRDQAVFGVRFEGRHYDAGDRIGYLKANIELSLDNPRLAQPLREYLSRMA